MLVEEFPVIFVVMKALRCEHGRDHRHLGVELNAHQRADHRIGDEFVPIDAAIDDETGGDDR
jgi:hypothetical protein